MTRPVDFDDLYQQSPDPWNLSTNSYEHAKYEHTQAIVAALEPRSLFEPACSIGLLTRLLTAVCPRVVASDISPIAVQQAQHNAPDAVIDAGHMPIGWPSEKFDVVVASEFLYYLNETDRHSFYQRCDEHLVPTGSLVLVHWRHDFDEAFLTGDEVHAEAESATAWNRAAHHQLPDYVLTVLTRSAD